MNVRDSGWAARIVRLWCARQFAPHRTPKSVREPDVSTKGTRYVPRNASTMPARRSSQLPHKPPANWPAVISQRSPASAPGHPQPLDLDILILRVLVSLRRPTARSRRRRSLLLEDTLIEAAPTSVWAPRRAGLRRGRAPWPHRRRSGRIEDGGRRLPRTLVLLLVGGSVAWTTQRLVGTHVWRLGRFRAFGVFIVPVSVHRRSTQRQIVGRGAPNGRTFDGGSVHY